MARFKLPATMVLLHVCRLSAESSPTDLLLRANDNNGQQPTRRAARARAGVRTRTYGDKIFVDLADYEDEEVVDLGHATVSAEKNGNHPVAAGTIRARNLKNKGIKSGLTNFEHDAVDTIANRAQDVADPEPIYITPDDAVVTSSSSDNSTVRSANATSPPSNSPHPTSVDSDPTPDHDQELDHFRTEHIFDPEYNGGDTFVMEEEMAMEDSMEAGGMDLEFSPSGAEQELEQIAHRAGGGFVALPDDFHSFSLSFSLDHGGRSCKSSKSKGKGKGKGGKSSKGGGKGKGKGYVRCTTKSSKSSSSSKSSKGGKGKGKGDGGYGKGGSKGSKGSSSSRSSSSKGSKGAYRHRFAPPADDSLPEDAALPQQRYRALWANGRGLRGEDQGAAIREEDPELQGVAAAIAAHQKREVRQQRQKLKRRRNRTPEQKAKDRAQATQR